MTRAAPARLTLLAAVSGVAAIAAGGPAPAAGATVSASIADAVSGTVKAPKPTSLSFAIDVRPQPEPPEPVGMTSLALQLPPGIRVVTAPASACTQDMLRAEPVPPACASAQVGSGAAGGYAIGMAWQGAATAYRDPDGTSLNVRLSVGAGGVAVAVPMHVAVAPTSSGGTSLDAAIPPIQVADNEFVDLRTLSLTLGAASAGSAITTTSCASSWAFAGSVARRVGEPVPIASTQACTQGVDPPAAATALPALAPRLVLRRSSGTTRKRRTLGRLAAIDGLRSLPAGTTVTARCARACSPRHLGSLTLGGSSPKSLRLSRPVSLTASSRIELDAVKAGSIGRYVVVRVVLRDATLRLRVVESGCLTAAGAHGACPAAGRSEPAS